MSDISIAGEDGISFFTAPFRFDGDSWETTAIVAATIGLGMSLDRTVRSEVFRFHYRLTPSQRDFFYWGTKGGTILVVDAVTIGLYAAGLVSGNEDIRITGRMAGQALFYSGLLGLCLQYGLGRNRPYATEDPFEYLGFQSDNEFQAMPSGHTIMAFALSTVLAERIDTWWSRAVFYSFASFVSLSTMAMRQHWLSDLLVGAGIGYAAGRYVIEREEQRHTAGSDAQMLDVLPSPGGFHLAFHF